MIDYELTDLLIELEEIQQDRFLNLARGQQVVDLLAFYHIPESLFILRQEPQNGRQPHDGRHAGDLLGLDAKGHGSFADQVRGEKPEVRGGFLSRLEVRG